MMNRRTFLRGLTLGAVAAPLAAEAQPAGKIWRIGTLTGQPPESPMWAPFREQLCELGYLEGQNIIVEWRSSRGNAERFPDLAADLVRVKVDVIVASGDPAIAAAQKASQTTPIVIVLAMDPVATGVCIRSGAEDSNR